MGVSCCFDAPTQSPEELYFHQKYQELEADQKSASLQDFLAMASELQKRNKAVTLGEARDRIVQLTQILARKEYQVLFINKEKEFYKKAFNETHEQNKLIKQELTQFQNQLTYQLSDSHILSRLQVEMATQIKTVREVS